MDDARAQPPDRRWDELAADLEARSASLASSETYAQAADRARSELAGLTLLERLRGGIGRDVTVCARGDSPVHGALTDVGADWLLVVDGARETFVRLGALLSVSGLGSDAQASALTSPVDAGLGLAHVARRSVRDRSEVRIVLDTGDVLTGTPDLAGADHLELAQHEPGEARRARAVVGRRLVPYAALATISRTRTSGPRRP